MNVLSPMTMNDAKMATSLVHSFIASFTVPLWTSVLGPRTLKAAVVDTLFVIFFGL